MRGRGWKDQDGKADSLEGDLPAQPTPSNPVERDALEAITPESECTLSCPTFPFNTLIRTNVLQCFQPEKDRIRDRSDSASEASRGVSGP